MKSRIILRAATAFALVFALAAFGAAFSVDAQEYCIQVITFAEDPETGECVAFPTPCDVPEGWESCNGGGFYLASNNDVTASAQEKFELCIQVITFAKNPETGECEMFPTPCDVPEGWEICDGPIAYADTTDATASAQEKGQACIQVITYAEHPGTGECIAFPTPCDVPAGWDSCDPGTTL